MHTAFAKGFRPFFLLGAIHAVVIVPVWLLAYRGHLGVSADVAAYHWHAHEMLHGFTMAIIAGFLLTAVSNWTKRETLVGAPLAAIAGIWLLGRLVMWPGNVVPPIVVAAIDLAFLPALVVGIARPLVAARNRRNYGFPFLLFGLWLGNGAYHADVLGLLDGAAAPGMRASLMLVLCVIAIVAGRIIPFFTRNATGAEGIRSIVAADWLTLAGLVVLAAFEAGGMAGPAVAVACGVTGLAAAVRSTRWGFTHTLRDPLLCVLHVGHAWLAVGLILRAVSPWGPGLVSLGATHALGLGVIGTLTLAMMARVALGHTGRPRAANAATTVAFGLVVTAGVVRVGGSIALPGLYVWTLIASGVLWTLAFSLYLTVFTPILLSPRPDGKPG